MNIPEMFKEIGITSCGKYTLYYSDPPRNRSCDDCIKFRPTLPKACPNCGTPIHYRAKHISRCSIFRCRACDASLIACNIGRGGPCVTGIYIKSVIEETITGDDDLI